MKEFRAGCFAALTVFSLLSFSSAFSFGASTHTTIYSFAGPDGAQPFSTPVFDAKGNVYGTTMVGGSYGAGVIFELSQGTNHQWTETILYEFTGGTDGANPSAGLVFDGKGNLYGTAGFGGAHGTGVVFELSPQAGSWSYEVLYSFGAYPASGDGFAPDSPIVFDKQGNIYGTTNEGGVPGCFQGCGTVFELSPDGKGGWTEQLLHEFTADGKDGELPTGGLVFDVDGALYGTTLNGGTAGDGAVYRLKYLTAKKSWAENIVHSFTGATNDGDVPNYVILITDAAGNLYGTTEGGGVNGHGAVFELMYSTKPVWPIRVLYSFQETYSGDGNDPQTGLVMDKQGNLYGTTFYGGADNYNGTIFRLSRLQGGGWKETVLYSFTGGEDGFFPQAGLAIHNGLLYGTAWLGGNSNSGVVFQNSF
jgi:uncharacterized repeat protein (TIGR03803 family)